MQQQIITIKKWYLKYLNLSIYDCKKPNRNNRQVDNAKDIDVEMPMYNLIEYNDNYRKTSGSLWQYYRDEPALTAAGAFDNFRVNSIMFKFKKINRSNRCWWYKRCCHWNNWVIFGDLLKHHKLVVKLISL